MEESKENSAMKLINLGILILKAIYEKLLGIFGVQLTEKKWNDFLQFIKFGIVGFSNTAISYIVYLIIVSTGLHYLIGHVCGFIIGVLNSYFWNNKYVFKQESGEERSAIKTLIKTFISYGMSSFVLATVLLIFWIDVLNLSEYIAPILNLVITIPINFVLNKVWAYKTKKM